MLVLRTPSEMTEWSLHEIKQGRSIGFIPTMGALHDGHVALMETSLLHNDRTVVSIFVNPLQFNNQNDLRTYPRQIEADMNVLTVANIDVLYIPTPEAMYPEGFASSVSAGKISASMEGVHRPGHFDGVATVVVKLLNAVRPDVAYFGLKDFQQLAVIRQVVRDLDIASRIVGVPTIRDADGLALSSRNVRLTTNQRTQAPVIYKLLTEIVASVRTGTVDVTSLRNKFMTIESIADAVVEYFEVVDSVTLQEQTDADNSSVICVAVWFGDVRLIDNISIA